MMWLSAVRRAGMRPQWRVRRRPGCLRGDCHV